MGLRTAQTVIVSFEDLARGPASMGPGPALYLPRGESWCDRILFLELWGLCYGKLIT
jgi:hypothetical protein